MGGGDGPPTGLSPCPLAPPGFHPPVPCSPATSLSCLPCPSESPVPAPQSLLPSLPARVPIPESCAPSCHVAPTPLRPLLLSLTLPTGRFPQPLPPGTPPRPLPCLPGSGADASFPAASCGLASSSPFPPSLHLLLSTTSSFARDQAVLGREAGPGPLLPCPWGCPVGGRWAGAVGLFRKAGACCTPEGRDSFAACVPGGVSGCGCLLKLAQISLQAGPGSLEETLCAASASAYTWGRGCG